MAERPCASFANVKCIAETSSAIRVVFEDREEPMWIPQSQVHADSEVYANGHEGTLVITQWLAEQRGLV